MAGYDPFKDLDVELDSSFDPWGDTPDLGDFDPFAEQEGITKGKSESEVPEVSTTSNVESELPEESTISNTESELPTEPEEPKKPWETMPSGYGRQVDQYRKLEGHEPEKTPSMFKNAQDKMAEDKAKGKTPSLNIEAVAALGSGIDMAQETAYRAIKGVLDVSGAEGEEADFIRKTTIAAPINAIFNNLMNVGDWASEKIEEEAAQGAEYEPSVQSYKDIDGFYKGGLYVVGNIFKSLPYMAMMMTPAGVAVGGAGTAQDVYDKQAEGEKNAYKALAAGSASVLLERFASKKVLENVPLVGQVAKGIKDPKGFAAGVGAAMITEGLTEVSQEMIQLWGYKELDKNWSDAISELELDEVFVAGAAAGGGLRAATHPFVKREQETFEQRVEQKKAEIDALEATEEQPTVTMDDALKQAQAEAEARADVKEELINEGLTPSEVDTALHIISQNEFGKFYGHPLGRPFESQQEAQQFAEKYKEIAGVNAEPSYDYETEGWLLVDPNTSPYIDEQGETVDLEGAPDWVTEEPATAQQEAAPVQPDVMEAQPEAELTPEEYEARQNEEAMADYLEREELAAADNEVGQLEGVTEPTEADTRLHAALEKADQVNPQAVDAILDEIDSGQITSDAEALSRLESAIRETQPEEQVSEQESKPEQPSDTEQLQEQETTASEAEPEPRSESTGESAEQQGEAAGLVTHTTKKGKELKGYVRNDMTKAQAKEIDPYTFKKDDGWFIREKHKDALDAYQPEAKEPPAKKPKAKKKKPEDETTKERLKRRAKEIEAKEQSKAEAGAKAVQDAKPVGTEVSAGDLIRSKGDMISKIDEVIYNEDGGIKAIKHHRVANAKGAKAIGMDGGTQINTPAEFAKEFGNYPIKTGKSESELQGVSTTGKAGTELPEVITTGKSESEVPEVSPISKAESELPELTADQEQALKDLEALLGKPDEVKKSLTEEEIKLQDALTRFGGPFAAQKPDFKEWASFVHGILSSRVNTSSFDTNTYRMAFGAISAAPEKFGISDDQADAMTPPRDVRKTDLSDVLAPEPAPEPAPSAEPEMSAELITEYAQKALDRREGQVGFDDEVKELKSIITEAKSAKNQGDVDAAAKRLTAFQKGKKKPAPTKEKPKAKAKPKSTGIDATLDKYAPRTDDYGKMTEHSIHRFRTKEALINIVKDQADKTKLGNDFTLSKEGKALFDSIFKKEFDSNVGKPKAAHLVPAWEALNKEVQAGLNPTFNKGQYSTAIGFELGGRKWTGSYNVNSPTATMFSAGFADAGFFTQTAKRTIQANYEASKARTEAEATGVNFVEVHKIPREQLTEAIMDGKRIVGAFSTRWIESTDKGWVTKEYSNDNPAVILTKGTPQENIKAEAVNKVYDASVNDMPDDFTAAVGETKLSDEVQSLIEGGTVKSMLTKIATTRDNDNITPAYRDIAARISKIVNPSARVYAVNQVNGISLGRARAQTTMRKDGDFTVRFKDDSFDHSKSRVTHEQTLLHEAIHVASMKAVNDVVLGKSKNPAQIKAVADLNKLRTDLLGKYQKSTALAPQGVHQALTDTDEFVAWGLTNPEVQKYLSEQKVKTKSDNALTAFVDTIRRLLGIKPNQSNALTELITLSDQLFTAIEGVANAEITTPSSPDATRSESAVSPKSERGRTAQPDVGLSGKVNRSENPSSEPSKTDVKRTERKKRRGNYSDDGASGKGSTGDGTRGNQGRAGTTYDNYRITAADKLGSGSSLDKAADNLNAIRILKALENDSRNATPAEQAELVKYSGWGAGDLANNLFTDKKVSPKWEALRSDLKDLLTKEEYKAAERTTQNAFYTPPELIAGMYKAVQNMGLNKGLVVEGGLGTGHFIGLKPDNFESIHTGFELDPITATIAEQLYPQSGVLQQDFTKVALPQNHFDLAIGNPPYANVTVKTDPKYNKLKPTLADYFILKQVDSLAPGGIGAFVTSRKTMDKKGAEVRKQLARKANLIGAIRLPQTAFKEHAGTEVITDVLFFQKHIDGDSNIMPSWVNDPKLMDTVEDTGEFNVNPFFKQNPSMVLGKESSRSGRYGDEYTVEWTGGDFEAELNKVIDQLPKDIVPEQPTIEQMNEKAARIELAPGKREDEFYIKADGDIWTVEDGVGVQVPTRTRDKKGLTKAQVETVKSYVPLRNSVMDVYRAARLGGNLSAAQQKMSMMYDQFVKKNGPINKHIERNRKNKDGTTTSYTQEPNLSTLDFDPEAFRVAGIEQYDPETGTAEKGEIFTATEFGKPATPEIRSATDALAVTLNDKGYVDLDYLETLYPNAREDVLAELGTAVFLDPASEKFVTEDEYLSGNVKAKLRIAKAANTDGSLDKNVKELQKVIPEDLPISKIPVNLGAMWVPESTVTRFAEERMNFNGNIGAFIQGENSSWKVEGFASAPQFATARVAAKDVLQAVLNRRSLKVYDTRIIDGKEKRELNTAETTAANQKAQDLKNAFQNWALKDADAAKELHNIYNNNFNTNVPRKFNGDHLTLPRLSSKYKLRPWQKDVVWRILQNGNTYMAHGVGAGKTLAASVAGIELKRLGIAKKPTYVVLKSTLKQFATEYLDAYPDANILVADEKQLDKKNRRRFLAKMASGDYDAVIMTHQSFESIPLSPETQKGMIEEQLEEYRNTLEGLEEKSINFKQMQSLIENKEQQLEAIINDTGKDAGITFEETGIDYLFVDEAHTHKKVSFPTAQTDVKGVDAQGSGIAQDLFFKSRYLNKVRPNRNMTLMSGTPVTNTLAELFNIQRYLQPHVLESNGTSSFDSWSATFADTVTELEMQADGAFKAVTRMAKFVGVPGLMRDVLQVMDVVTSKQMSQSTSIKRPKVRGGQRHIVAVEATEGLKEYQKELSVRIEMLENRKGPPKKGDDNILSVINDAQKAAMDLRLVGRHQDGASKIDALISDALQEYKDTSNNVYDSKKGPEPKKGGTQAIFCDSRLTKDSDFDIYAYIKAELVKGGVKPAEIAFIQDYNTAAKKKKLFREVNTGVKRFVLGGSVNLGTGTNIQQRLTAINHLDAPYIPAFLEQRDGRGVRAGNKNSEIRINAYATKGTVDAFKWQLLETKTRMIDQIMQGNLDVNEVADIGDNASQMAMAKALASGNPKLLEMAGLQQEVAKLQGLKEAHQNAQFAARQELANIDRRQRPELDAAAAAIDALPDKVTDTSGDNFKGKAGKATYDKRDEFGQAISDNAQQVIGVTGKSVKVGELGGVDLYAVGRTTDAEIYAGSDYNKSALIAGKLVGVPNTTVIEREPSMLGLARRVENAVRSIPAVKESVGEARKTLDRAAELAQETLDTKFQQEAELKEKSERINLLEQELETVTTEDADPVLTKNLEEDPNLSADDKRITAEAGNTFASMIKRKSKDIWKSLKGMAKERRRSFMALLTNDQLQEVYERLFKGTGDNNVVTHYFRELKAMEATRQSIMRNANDKVAKAWDKMDDAKAQEVSNVMHLATMSQLYPQIESFDAQPAVGEMKVQLKTGDDRQKSIAAARLTQMHRDHLLLQKNWKKLNAEQKGIYNNTEQLFKDHYKDLEQAIIERIDFISEDAPEMKGLIDSIRLEFTNQIKDGPYFPLTRFGDYVVIARDENNGYQREHFESFDEANARKAQLELEGFKVDKISKRASDYSDQHQDLPGFAQDLLGQITKSEAGVGDAKVMTTKQLKDDIYQSLLKSLPDASWAKSHIHRMRTPGASKDMRRAVANNVQHYAYHMGRIKHLHILDSDLTKMNEQIDEGEINAENRVIADDLQQEITARHDDVVTPYTDAAALKASNYATTAGFIYYLGGGISSAAVNLTQQALVAFPLLGSKFGFKNAGVEFAKAQKDFMQSSDKKLLTTSDPWVTLSKNKNLTTGEQNMIKALHDNGTIEVTQTHALSDLGSYEGGKETTNSRTARMVTGLSRTLGVMYHNAEVMNREVCALAAYRLLRQKGVAHVDAITQTQDLVYKSHFNYTSGNRARFMRSPLARTVFLFRQYSQNMVYLLTRQAATAFNQTKFATDQERKEARRMLTGMMAVSFGMSGMLGMPLMKFILDMLSASMGSEDEPYDAEADFRNFLADLMGPEVGRAVALGPLSTTTGLNFHSRVGLGDLVYRSEKGMNTATDLLGMISKQLAGPVYGMGENLARGFDSIKKGDVYRGTETMAPKFIKDVMKSGRFAMEGSTTWKGDPIVDEFNPVEIAGQAIGFSPLKQGEAFAARQTIKNKERRLKDRRKTLLSQLEKSIRTDNDSLNEKTIKAILDFNEKNPELAISSDNIKQSLKSKARSSSQTLGGIYLDKKSEHLREEGRFADYGIN